MLPFILKHRGKLGIQTVVPEVEEGNKNFLCTIYCPMHCIVLLTKFSLTPVPLPSILCHIRHSFC